MRTEHREVIAIATAKMTIGLSDGQFFCRTNKAWEIWQENPLMRLKRIPIQRVFWIYPKDDTNH